MARGSTTLVFTFYPGMRLQSREALGVAISRLIEERVGLAEGMEDIRKWLIIISKAFSPHSSTHFVVLSLINATVALQSGTIQRVTAILIGDP